ncbi:MAG: major capsid protein [Pseudomonadota bacterium]
MTMSTAQVRVVDPVLTTHARGYRHPKHVGIALFPNVSIPLRGVKRLEFGKESFRLYNTRRAPGGATKRVDFGYQGVPVNLHGHSLEGKVPWEHLQEAATSPGLDLAKGAVNLVLKSMSLEREVAQATIARDATKFDANHKVALAGGDQWSDPNSDPKADVDAAKEAVRRSIGDYPNTMVIGPGVFLALQNHPKIAEKFKYTGRESITTDMLALYFDLEKVEVGKAVYLAEADADTADFTDAWGKDAILAYVPHGEESWEVPSFGYTYHLEGHPFVEQPYSERNVKSWLYPVTDEYSVEDVGRVAGFLIQNAVA